MPPGNDDLIDEQWFMIVALVAIILLSLILGHAFAKWWVGIKLLKARAAAKSGVHPEIDDNTGARSPDRSPASSPRKSPCISPEKLMLTERGEP